MFGISFLRRPAPRFRNNEPMRARDGRYAPSPRSLEESRRMGSVNAQLGVYIAVTTHEQRLAEFNDFVARVRETENQRFHRLAPVLFRGLAG